jgi:ubiquinone biosynthesis protein
LALVRDLVSTLQVLARFGPKLPRLVEDALIARGQVRPSAPRLHRLPFGWAVLGVLVALAAGVALGHWL